MTLRAAALAAAWCAQGCTWWVAAGAQPSLDTLGHAAVEASVRGGVGLGGIEGRRGTGMGASVMLSGGVDGGDGTLRASALLGPEVVHVGNGRWGLLVHTMAGVGAAHGGVRPPVVRWAIGAMWRVRDRVDRSPPFIDSVALTPWVQWARNPTGTDDVVFGLGLEFVTLRDPELMAPRPQPRGDLPFL